MDKIIEVIKECAKKIEKVIETGNSEYSSTVNSTGDDQLELDVLSDEIIEMEFKKLDCIKEIISEEKDDIVKINPNGKYLIGYDPLDGSSLIDVNLSVGSIFGIYENSFNGKDLVASVYVVYGPRVELVIAIDEVKLYRLIDNQFKFIKNIKLNEKGKLNASGGTQKEWFNFHKKMIDGFFQEGYRLRYSGGMVPDLHQILLKGGGLFSYPATKDKPKSKLRKVFEVFPFADIFEKAGGLAIDSKNRLLDLDTDGLHDTCPCFFGSKYGINIVKEIYNLNSL